MEGWPSPAVNDSIAIPYNITRLLGIITMATLFLCIIYMAFISLGLPDSLLGVAWPVMHLEFGAPSESAGLVSMVISGGTIVSSLMSGVVVKKLGTGWVVFISCLMTASALLGFSLAPSLIWLIVLAIPLGLGAGSVDAGLNNYVATHYKAHHMSWLHCFWGVGATIGPLIMSGMIDKQKSWRSGYFTVSMIQFALVVILFLALPLWGRIHPVSSNVVPNEDEGKKTESAKPLRIKGVKFALAAFLFYCGAESTIGLWGSSFLVQIKGLSPAVAAQWVSLYYGGITVGRFISGFITLKLSNKKLIRLGQGLSLTGILLVLLSLPSWFSFIGFIMIGLGYAPVFPCMIHETPVRFSAEHSQTIIGYQMALAYTGTTFLPPLLGGITAITGMSIFPYFVVLCNVLTIISCEIINRIMKRKQTIQKAMVNE